MVSFLPFQVHPTRTTAPMLQHLLGHRTTGKAIGHLMLRLISPLIPFARSTQCQKTCKQPPAISPATLRPKAQGLSRFPVQGFSKPKIGDTRGAGGAGASLKNPCPGRWAPLPTQPPPSPPRRLRTPHLASLQLSGPGPVQRCGHQQPGAEHLAQAQRLSRASHSQKSRFRLKARRSASQLNKSRFRLKEARRNQETRNKKGTKPWAL